MDTSGEVADLMVKESIQLTESSIKLLAAGSKNLAALLWAFAKDEKKLIGHTGMTRLIREGKPLKVFHIKESDLEDFKEYARKNVLYSVVKDNQATDGMVDLVTNVDFVAQVNLFMERRGYGSVQQGEEPPKKEEARAPQDSSSPQRGNGSTPTRARTTRTTTDAPEKPSVKEKLAECQKEASRRAAQKQRTRPQKKR